MKVPLYSDAHLEAAKKLFPEKINDPLWLNQQWTDEEINCCKAIELTEDLENNPTFSHWEKKFLSGQKIETYNDEILQWYKDWIGHRKMDVLSVGCGAGIREIALVVSDRVKSIVGIDISPHVNILNDIVPDEISLKVKFIEGNCFTLPFDDDIFDLVLSHGLIYCIPDSLLKAYFSEMLRVVKPGGVCLVSTAANISPMDKLRIRFKGHKRPNNWKQTGWRRDRKHIIKFLPTNAEIKAIRNMRHEGQLPRVLKENGKLGIIRKILIWFSNNIYPLSNTVVAFKLTK